MRIKLVINLPDGTGIIRKVEYDEDVKLYELNQHFDANHKATNE